MENPTQDPEKEEVRDADLEGLDERKTADDKKGGDGHQEPGFSSDEALKLKAELDETKDKYLRALAELENFKKRALKERSELLKYQGEPVLGDMVQVLDNLERAVQHSEAEPGALKSGLELILKQFLDTLAKWEVRGIPSVGQPFDPARFNAVSRVPVDDAVPGTIISELKKAYMYKDRLLRPGDVVVAAERPAAAQNEGATEEKAS